MCQCVQLHNTAISRPQCLATVCPSSHPSFLITGCVFRWVPGPAVVCGGVLAFYSAFRTRGCFVCGCVGRGRPAHGHSALPPCAHPLIPLFSSWGVCFGGCPAVVCVGLPAAASVGPGSPDAFRAFEALSLEAPSATSAFIADNFMANMLNPVSGASSDADGTTLC